MIEGQPKHIIAESYVRVGLKMLRLRAWWTSNQYLYDFHALQCAIDIQGTLIVGTGMEGNLIGL